jgi:hypothetical protein
MCVYDGEGRREVYGEVRVETDRVDVEQRDKRGACVVGELSKDLGTNGCGRYNEGVGSQGVRFGEP